MKKLLSALALVLVLTGLATTVAWAANSPDTAIGTWKLNLEKSKFHGDNTALKAMTRTYSAGSAGTDMKVTGVAADGAAISQSGTLTYDGKDCTVSGLAAYDTLSLTRVNGTTVKAVLKKDGKVVGHSTRSMSAGGKVMTISTAWKTDKGGTVHDVAVYDKQ